MKGDDIGALREGWDFEAKLAAGPDGRGAVPNSFWETYSAMANGRGGRIVLGLREHPDGTLEAQGVPDIDRVERDLWNTLQNRRKVNVNLLAPEDVARRSMGDRTVLVVTVHRARRQDRPVYVDDDLWRGTFLRVHEGDRRADRERIRRMIAEAEYDTRDERVLGKMGITDLAPESLRDYRNAFRDRHPDHPWGGEPDETFLHRLGVLGRDRESGEGGCTLAGLLMFGRYETIREVLPNYFVDYQERRTGTGAIEWDDRVYPDGTWSGNVYDFFRRAVVRLKADLKVPFRLDREMVRIDETHVHEAVREALVNMLIHADYEGRVSTLAVKRSGGFEFRNPGGLRISPEQLRLGGVSDCRNRTLQRLFLLVGMGEQVGSGFSRIERAWRERGWPPPRIVENIEGDTTTLVLETEKRLAVKDGATSSATSSVTSSGTGGFEGSATARAILDACRGRFLTVKELSALVEKNPVTIRRTLPGLLEAGRLERKFPDRPRDPRQAYRTAGIDAERGG